MGIGSSVFARGSVESAGQAVGGGLHLPDRKVARRLRRAERGRSEAAHQTVGEDNTSRCALGRGACGAQMLGCLSMLPGQLEAGWAKHTAAAGGLLFSKAEVEAFNELATEAGQPLWDLAALKSVTI